MMHEQPPEFMGPGKAMVVFAHPDDAEFMCAGTVAKWCAEGWEVIYVSVTSGQRGSREPGMTGQRLAAIREREQRAACRSLGVRHCVFLGFQDGYVEQTPELRGEIVRQIRTYCPDIVITWDGFYRRAFNHRDHRNVGIVTYDAVYPCASDPLYYPEQIEEGLTLHRPAEIWLAGSDEPDHHIDITDFVSRKLDAAMCHVSQMRGRTREQVEQRWRERMHHRYEGLTEGSFYESFTRVLLRR
jgi:LmbE family N-acetylglucosaminyl deacetylase